MNQMLSAGLVPAIEYVTKYGGPGACSPEKFMHFYNLRNAILEILVELLPYC